MRPAAVLTATEKREYTEWLQLCERIKAATPVPVNESEDEKTQRINRLRNSFTEFCKFYFPNFIDAEFGWFHKQAAAKIQTDPNIRIVLEWPREHAKSVFSDVFIPMYLYARGELSGMLIASATQEKAEGLLGDIQAQFTSNERFIADYGARAAFGDWRDAHFATTDGCGFWAFGRGQSPRGVRKAAKRPNYAVVDDIDDKVIIKNQSRVREAVDWVIEDLYGACSIKGARLVIVGNRIHKHSILSHLVGDTEPDQPKRDGWQHIKVFALEDSRHRKAINGQPAWKERYTRDQITSRMKVMGTRSAMREYFHEHTSEGNIFKHDWIVWGNVPTQFDHLEVYCDPSFKDTKDNDYKAIVAIGKKGAKYYVVKAWIKQASISAMVDNMYEFYKEYQQAARYRIEANFMQDMLLKEFDKQSEITGSHVPIVADRRKKPDKVTRVENLTPLFERGFWVFNEDNRKTPDMQTLVDQFLSFPTGHDDGPDACEGAVYYLNRNEASSKFVPRIGSYSKNKSRKAQ